MARKTTADAPPFKSRILHYKRAHWHGDAPASLNLEKLVKAAMATSRTAMGLQEKSEEDHDNVRVWNKCKSVGKLLCGQYFSYTIGGHAAALVLDDTAEELKIEHLSPEEQRQFINGTLTFGIQRNHVLVVQSNAVRIGEFEKHLNTLLTQTTKVLSDQYAFTLQDVPEQQLRNRLTNVREVSLTSWVPARAPAGRPRDGTPAALRAGLSAVIRQFLSEHILDSLTGLKADEAVAADDLQISLQIKRGSRRQSSGLDLLDEIAHTLRHAEGNDFVLDTKIGRITADEIKVHVVKKLPILPSGIPELRGTGDVMHQWLADLLTEQRIRESIE